MKNLLKTLTLFSAISLASPVPAQDLGLPKDVPSRFENYKNSFYSRIDKNYSSFRIVNKFYDINNDSVPDVFESYILSKDSKSGKYSEFSDKTPFFIRGFDINSNGDFNSEEIYDEKNKRVYPSKYYPLISKRNCA